MGGSVLLWGRVIRHAYGYRAEYARPHRLLAMPHLRKDKQALLVATAQRYHLMLVRRCADLFDSCLRGGPCS